jgi:AraC-like DNA-binding protein
MHLCHYSAILTPLLTPRFFETENYLFLYWLDNSGAGQQHTFLVEAYMTAVYAMSNWLSKEKLPWQFYFTYAEPRYIEQYWVHLNEDIHFKQQLNMMRIPKDCLIKPWPNSAPISLKMAELNSKIQLNELGWRESFLDQLYDYLKKNIQSELYLDDVAEAFGMSAASFKRKLQKHDTHFQAQLDLARKHVALYLFQVKGYQHQEVADYLRFNDLNNFRRAFKRWTGFSASQLLQGNCF